MSFTFAFGCEHGHTPPCRPEGKADIFVVGVYASAVHAAWHGPDGKQLCQALAVAPEPWSFWDGSDAGERISDLAAWLPSGAGKLVPARSQFNGSSGRALKELYLEPLGNPRAWLTDLHPVYYLSPGNAAALDRHYRPMARKLGLPPAELPARPPQVRPSRERLEELEQEFLQSGAELILTLGNEPIPALFDGQPSRLSREDYGRIIQRKLLGKYPVQAIHLVHPLQAARLGTSSSAWGTNHANWIQRVQAGRKLKEVRRR